MSEGTTELRFEDLKRIKIAAKVSFDDLIHIKSLLAQRNIIAKRLLRSTDENEFTAMSDVLNIYNKTLSQFLGL